mgnify:CR=1 FL=1
MLRSFDDEDEWSVEHIGKRSAGCIALDTIGIDGAVEKFVWNEEDGIGFLIQDNSYLDFIKSSFTSRPVFAMQAADGRITYSTEDLMKEMWPKERIEDPVSVVAWRPYGFALQEDGSFFFRSVWRSMMRRGAGACLCSAVPGKSG